MQIVIDIESPTPLFAQLIAQVKLAVAKQVIKSGDAMPSIRQLAIDLELNSKTVAKAYKLLERDSVLQSRGYRGTYVHPDAAKNCQVDMEAQVTSRLTEVVHELRTSGATDSEIRIAFNSAMSA